MAYKMLLLDEARFEVIEAALYYKQFSEELAVDIVAKFFYSLSVITEEPLLFQAGPKGYRQISLKRFPYKIVFKLTVDSVVVVAFAHHKRNPGYWRNR